MPPKSQNGDCKRNTVNGQSQNVKVDLTKINIKTLASQIGVLSDDVKLYMELLTSKRYYALNDRTINLRMKGDVDMSATTGETGEAGNLLGEPSDGELQKLANNETKVEVFVAGQNKTRSGGAFFPCLNITIFDLSKYGIFEIVDRRHYKHNCLYLALQSGGLSDIELQELVLSLRNRHIHKCDLDNVCNTLEIHIELISLISNGETRVEHYGK